MTAYSLSLVHLTQVLINVDRTNYTHSSLYIYEYPLSLSSSIIVMSNDITHS